MAKLQSINPFTEELNGEFETLEACEVDEIIEKAHDAYKVWKDTSL